VGLEERYSGGVLATHCNYLISVVNLRFMKYSSLGNERLHQGQNEAMHTWVSQCKVCLIQGFLVKDEDVRGCQVFLYVCYYS
jgi:hypothetical protein